MHTKGRHCLAAGALIRRGLISGWAFLHVEAHIKHILCLFDIPTIYNCDMGLVEAPGEMNIHSTQTK
jgi:hypothetical protein